MGERNDTVFFINNMGCVCGVLRDKNKREEEQHGDGELSSIVVVEKRFFGGVCLCSPMLEPVSDAR